MLCNMKELLKEAEEGNWAVGSFSVHSMENVKGVIQAAEETNTPIIIQVAEARLSHAPLPLMAPMMLEAASSAKVRVAVHLDHGIHLETIQRALEYGFTSVMLDASKEKLRENIKKTCQVMELAAKYNAAVEAELGSVGGNEGNGEVNNFYTKPDEVMQFVQETQVDALAVAIGNAHGNYKQLPKLRYDILERIHNESSIPLVLHGGTGISFEEFRKTIDHGVRKINIATANLETMVYAAKNLLQKKERVGYFELSDCMSAGVAECTRKHIYVFNNKGSLEELK